MRTKTVSGLDGTLTQMQVSNNFLVISCSDCANPMVSFYDKDLTYKKSFSLPRMTKENYNLAVWERNADTLQVFVSGRAKIDMIEYQRDPAGNEIWLKTDSIFEMDVEPTSSASHEIYLAKSEDYLVFKLTSQPKIYVIAVCDFGFTLNQTSFKCEACPISRKSFGI
jgi:hypothetical protein